jgi:hypothetical protein
MSTKQLAKFGEAITATAKMVETQTDQLVRLQLRLVLLFFGEEKFSSVEARNAARQVAIFGGIDTDFVLGPDGILSISFEDVKMPVGDLQTFEAICLKLTAA